MLSSFENRKMESLIGQQFISPRIYMCGFMSKRSHTRLLRDIACDLMPWFNVSCNATKGQLHLARSSHAIIVEQADIVIFWRNQFTLNQPRFQRVLQIAHELSLPVIFLQRPITDTVHHQGDAITFNYHNGSYYGPQIKVNLSDQIIPIGGKTKTIYFDSQFYTTSLHNLIRVITSMLPEKKIGKLAHIFRRRYASSHSLVSDPSEDHGSSLMLPRMGPNSLTHSFTIGNISGYHRKDEQKALWIRRTDFKRNSAAAIITRRRRNSTKRPANKRQAQSAPNRPRPRSQPPSVNKCVTPDSLAESGYESDRLLLPGCYSLSDPSIYQPTRYLIFSRSPTIDPPKLLRFPDDLATPDGQIGGLSEDFSDWWENNHSSSDDGLDVLTKESNIFDQEFREDTPPV